MMDNQFVETVIVGAGPFGLSIAAHLRQAGRSFRIFGVPMHSWIFHMPKGMYLKSEGRASSLSEPSGKFTLARFCADKGIQYSDRSLPVAIETFIEYALEFQRRYVPDVEKGRIAQVENCKNGFEIASLDGSRIHARNVVLATGLEGTAYTPQVFATLPKSCVSHSSDHCNLASLRGKNVTVIGAGQSAIETLALLLENEVKARLVARKPLYWNSSPNLERSVFWHLRYPVSDLGEGIQTWLLCRAPSLYRYLPKEIRIRKVHEVLGPAGSWWLRGRVEGKADVSVGTRVVKAEFAGGQVHLFIERAGQPLSTIQTDHVIAATGYRYDLARLSLLSDGLKRAIRTEAGRPDVSAQFESSVPGLYFAGLATSYRFGPLMRFVAGTGVTARTIAAHIYTQQDRAASRLSELPRFRSVAEP